MNITLRKSLAALLVIGGFFLSPISVSASLLKAYDEGSEGAANEKWNHRMENAFLIDDDQFDSSSVGDYIDIKGYGRYGDAALDFGDTFRAYLHAGVTYRAYTNPLDRFTAPNNVAGSPPTDVIHDTTLTVVDGGPPPAANNPDFDFSASGYKFLGSNDIGNDSNQFAFSSKVDFTADRTGYYYFFVTERFDSTFSGRYYGGASSSSDTDDDPGNYLSYGDGIGTYGGVQGGMFVKDNGTGYTPTGSVFGDLSATYTYWLRLEQTGGNPPVNAVPEPSSIAIFSVVGIGGLMLRRRMKKKS